MKIIVGLGNKGLEFEKTRHNIGFEVVKLLAYRHNITMNTTKLKGLVGKGVINGHKVMLAMPLTYMNLSGQCVRAIADFYKLTEEDLVVAYDDISMDLGSLRIRPKGSAGGHNGIKNIIAHLGTDEFARFKVGVGPQPNGLKAEKFVLARFPSKDSKKVDESVEYAADAIEAYLEKGLDFSMNNYNRKV